MIGLSSAQPWTPDEWEAALTVWENALIAVLDIRHRLIEPGEAIRDYSLPAHALIVALNGPCSVSLGHDAYLMERFAVLHAPKGMPLTIEPMEGWLDFYLILYKATLNSACLPENRSFDGYKPLQRPCAINVANPLHYIHCCSSMHDCWQRPHARRKLHALTGFYQLVREIGLDLEQDRLAALPPDYVRMTQTYMEQNYHLPLTVQGLAEALGISASQLNRLFKQRCGAGPQEYLKEVRLQAARQYLQLYPASLKEVAHATGICDEFYLSRLIRSRFGMTAEQLRKKSTNGMRDFFMEQTDQAPYTVTRFDNENHFHNRGETIMLKKLQHKMLLTAAVSFMLVSSACGSANNASSAGNVALASPAASGASHSPSAAASETPDANATRTVNTEKGEVEIPLNPKRIIVPFVQGDLMALGIKPVGTSFNDDAVFEEEMGDTSIGIPWELDLEAVMALEPDLIIYANPDEYEKLKLIAPTVIISDLYSMESLQRLQLLGDLVNRKDKAEELVKQFKEKVADSKAKLEQAGLLENTVSLFEWKEAGTVSVFGNKYGRGGELLYSYLGMKAPQRIQEEIIDHPDDPRLLVLSMEVVAEYQGDFIFSDELVVNLEGNPVWESLTAVKEGRLIQTSSGMFWFNDILSMNAQLDFITTRLLEAAGR